MPPKIQETDQPIPIWKLPDHNKTTVVVIPESSVFDKKITGVLIYVTTAATSGEGCKPAAHFRLFLRLKWGFKKQVSVELNSHTTSASPTKANLYIHFRNYMGSTASQRMGDKFIDFKNGEHPSVMEVVTLILQKNRDHYELDKGSGSGCRFWCETVLKDFAEKGWVDGEAWKYVNQLAMALKADDKWKDTIDIPIPAPQGVFTQEVTNNNCAGGSIEKGLVYHAGQATMTGQDSSRYM